VKLSSRSTLSTVAVAVGEALERHGIRAVLTGGACASFYAGGAYTSVDADFVLTARVTQKSLDEAMGSIGFARRGDRYVHADLRFFVEFPRGPLAIGEDVAIRPVRAGRGRARAWMLSATDACRDRLAAFYHWEDRQSLSVAVAIARRNPVSMSIIRRWSLKENAEESWKEFVDELERARASNRRRHARKR